MKALDLFCCGGGAARGLVVAGFDVTGIDIDPRNAKAYPGKFVCHDLTTGLPAGFDPADYDLVWASPPCQLFTTLRRPESARTTACNLIPLARRLLAGHRRGVIENVPEAAGAGHMRADVTLTGPMVGLNQIRRKRVFEFTGDFFLLPPNRPVHAPAGGWKTPGGKPIPVLTDGASQTYRAAMRRKGLRLRPTKQEKLTAMGYSTTENLTHYQIGESIPPAYATYLATLLMDMDIG